MKVVRIKPMVATLAFCLMAAPGPAQDNTPPAVNPDAPPGLKPGALRVEHPNCRHAKFSPDGRLLVTVSSISQRSTAGQKPTIAVWDATNGKSLAERAPSFLNGPPPEFSSDGRLLVELAPDSGVSAKRKIEVARWELPTLKPVGEPLKLESNCRLAIGPAALFLTAISQGGGKWEICVRDLITGKPVGKTWQIDGLVGMHGMAFTQDGKQVFISSSVAKSKTFHVQRYDVESGAPIGMPWTHSAFVTTLVLSPDNKAAATVALPFNAIELQAWNVETDKSVGAPVRPAGGGFLDATSTSSLRRTFVIHRDARTLAYISGNKLGVRVINLATEKELCPELKQDTPVARLTFSPDGKRLLTVAGALDGPCFLWDLATGRRIARVPLEGMVEAAAFRPDGKMLVTVNEKGKLSSWELPTAK